MKLWPFFTSKRIYADAAAATPLSRSAKRELLRLLPLFGNPGSLHSEGVQAKQELENAREKVAKTIGAHADEIIFTSGGTEANNLALFGTLRPLLHARGELNAITSAIEHLSVLEPLRTLERDGLYTTELSVNESGHIAAKELREALSEETALVSVQMVNSEIGTIQNIREIAKEIRHARRSRVESPGANAPSPLPLYFHTDASQAPLWLPIKVEKLGIDMLTLDAQKMMGSKGAGALYIKRGTDLEPLLWGGGQERGLRSGTENAVMAGALATALEEAQTGVEERAQRIELVRDFMFKEIQKRIPEAELNGAIGKGRVANNINISIPGLDGEMAVIALDAEGVAVSARSACSSDDEEPSYVIKALGKSGDKAKSAIRITLLPSATMADAAHIANALAIVAKRYRNVV